MSSPTLLTPTSKLKLLLPVIAKPNSTVPPTYPTPPPAFEADDEEYVKGTSDVISKVRSTINVDKNDPNVATEVAELRDTSNSWVAKHRREKSLLGRASFRLSAVSAHYISFGPKAPIPAKRKARRDGHC